MTSSEGSMLGCCITCYVSREDIIVPYFRTRRACSQRFLRKQFPSKLYCIPISLHLLQLHVARKLDFCQWKQWASRLCHSKHWFSKCTRQNMCFLIYFPFSLFFFFLFYNQPLESTNWISVHSNLTRDRVILSRGWL